MDNLAGFTTSAVDWRSQLRRNQHRTRAVIAVFILFYLGMVC